MKKSTISKTTDHRLLTTGRNAGLIVRGLLSCCPSFNPRVLIAFLVLTAACSLVTGSLLAFLRSANLENAPPRSLSLQERVSYQRAIEDVYWRHRIWPNENPNPKPSLDTVMSQTQIEKKVTDYLRKSQALEAYWQRPITAEQLQAEMNRMAEHTKQPEVLQELFEALGNDPFIIAQCLARSRLADRLIQSAEGSREQSGQLNRLAGFNTPDGTLYAGYSLPVIATMPDTEGMCVNNTWTDTSLVGVPTARTGHTAVWTGSEMIAWGGNDFGGNLNTGGRYEPSTDSWTTTSTVNAPEPRTSHTAVWTGSEMIIWGGQPVTNTGGRYNPTADNWTPTSIADAPDGRFAHTAVWAGNEMIVWGGFGFSFLNTGGKYNPSTDSWTDTSTTDAPSSRDSQTAIWTGSEMIVWGGFDDTNYLNTGGRYNPIADNWTDTNTANAPSGRHNHTAVWTGSEMIVWGGFGGAGGLRTGGRYDPALNSWAATSIANAPSGRELHTAILSENEMIVWGGFGGDYFDTGGRYNPIVDSWTATSTTNAPTGRYAHTAIWSGSEMIVWGGTDDAHDFNTGGRYCTQSGPTPTPSPTVTPSVNPTITPTATPRVTPRPRPTPHPRPTPG